MSAARKATKARTAGKLEDINESLRVALQRARDRSRRNARLAEVRRVAIVATLERLGEMEERLRATAAGLREWDRRERTGEARHKESISPFHAANRLERMADEINYMPDGDV